MDSYYDMVDDIEALDMEGIMKVGKAGGFGAVRMYTRIMWASDTCVCTCPPRATLLVGRTRIL